jgi:hypothetical protein
MKMNLTDEEVRKEYEKRIMLFTLKTGKTPKRTKLFSYLFSIFQIKNFKASNVYLESGSKFDGFDKTAVFSKYHLRNIKNIWLFQIRDELRKHDFSRYIGNYKLDCSDDCYWINMHYSRTNVRWDLIDYDLRKYRPELVRENKNSFHILKNPKWVRNQPILNQQLSFI